MVITEAHWNVNSSSVRKLDVSSDNFLQVMDHSCQRLRELVKSALQDVFGIRMILAEAILRYKPSEWRRTNQMLPSAFHFQEILSCGAQNQNLITHDQSRRIVLVNCLHIHLAQVTKQELARGGKRQAICKNCFSFW